MNIQIEDKQNSTEHAMTTSKTCRTIPRPEERVTKKVDEWIKILADQDLEFVLSRLELIKQLRYFDGQSTSYFSTHFRRISDGYVYPTPVRIGNVIYGHTKIRTEQEKKSYQDEINAQHNPRGIDTPGNVEMARFDMWMNNFPKIMAKYKFEATVRGTLPDIIATNIETGQSFGLQIFTAAQREKGDFFYNKSNNEINIYIEAKIVSLGIGVVDDEKGGKEVAGGYMIPPTPMFKNELAKAKCKGTMKIQPTMLNKRTTPSKLNQILEQFRYIRTKFQDGVKGTFKTFDDFETNFLELCDKHPSILATPEYLKSLFNGESDHRTEWAGNVSYENNVLTLVSIEQIVKHGERGDILAKYNDGKFKFELTDERKILTAMHNKQLKLSNSWQCNLRKTGHQGLHPSKIDMIIAFLRSDRTNINPSRPEDFAGFIVLCVLTADGERALRPDDPSALTLCMYCNVAERDEYIHVKTDKIGANMFPDSMQMQDEEDDSMTKIKAVFYYDELKKPDGKRLRELLELYTMIAERRAKIKPSAIEAYETAVNDELISKEKAHLKELKLKNKKKKDEEKRIKDKLTYVKTCVLKF